MEGEPLKAQEITWRRGNGVNSRKPWILIQTNQNEDIVPQEDRFKWVDDLTVLEKINLINIGLSSYNFKQHVASDVPIEGYHVNGQDTKSQEYLNKINSWTVDHKMDINQKKTKAMLIN